jgi:hypothetical protein
VYLIGILRQRIWNVQFNGKLRIRPVSASNRAMSEVMDWVNELQVATSLGYAEICKIWGFHGGDYEECRLLQTAATCSRWFLDRRFFYPENGGDTFLRDVGSHKIYTAPHPRRRHSLYRDLVTSVNRQYSLSELADWMLFSQPVTQQVTQ